MRVYCDIACRCPCSISLSIRYVTLKFLSNALMKFGPFGRPSVVLGRTDSSAAVAASSSSSSNSSGIQICRGLLPCLLLCCAKPVFSLLAFRLRFCNCFFLSFILLSVSFAMSCPLSFIALENLLAINLAILSRRGSFFFFVNSRDRY